jgi:hypothetical protein
MLLMHSTAVKKYSFAGFVIKYSVIEAYRRDSVAQFEFQVCFKGLVLAYGNEHWRLCDISPKVDNTSEVNEENAPVAATNEFEL